MTALFRVHHHFHVTDHGSWSAGKIEAGTIRIGSSLENRGGSFLVAAVEFEDNVSLRESYVCLRFQPSLSVADLTTRFPEGQVLEVTEPSDFTIKSRRFWFPITGHFGIGVTANSEGEARVLANHAAELVGWPSVDQVVENIDIRGLDQKHVVPNMGPPNVRGVWFPHLRG